MSTENMRQFVISGYEDTMEWRQVLDSARKISEHIIINQNAINELNQPGRASKEIEDYLSPLFHDLGFSHEPRGEFGEQALRPDFVNNTMKAIVEVERGKILQNNMDMLDFWKVHIHGRYENLILIVPKRLYHGSETTPEKPFEKVASRLGNFFEPRNKTNVKGLIIIGF